MNEQTGLPYPDWQVAAQDVLLETGRAELPDKLQKAESLISERLQHLKHSQASHHEREALIHALALIRSVRQDRLEP
jgi:hypothetical protein